MARLSEQEKKRRARARQIEKARIKAQEARNKAKYYADEAKRLDKELRSFIKAAKNTGVYDIKLPKGQRIGTAKLSRHQRYRASKAMKAFGDFFDPAKFVLIVPPKSDLKKVKERAEGLGLKPTRRGFFAPTEGYQKVTLGYDRKRKEYHIKRSGKTKMGINKGKRYTKVTPLAGIDELTEERERIRRLMKKLEPLEGDERFAFEVREAGNEGYSHFTFTSLDDLFKRLEEYRKTTAARVNFYRHIHIVKTKSFRHWFKEHPPKGPKQSFGKRIYTKTDRDLRKKRG